MVCLLSVCCTRVFALVKDNGNGWQGVGDSRSSFEGRLSKKGMETQCGSRLEEVGESEPNNRTSCAGDPRDQESSMHLGPSYL